LESRKVVISSGTNIDARLMAPLMASSGVYM